MLFTVALHHKRPIKNPIIVGTNQPRPSEKNGKTLFAIVETLSIKAFGIILSFGNETIKSKIAVNMAKALVVAKTFLSKLNAFPNNASRIILIVSGYKNISTGTA